MRFLKIELVFSHLRYSSALTVRPTLDKHFIDVCVCGGLGVLQIWIENKLMNRFHIDKQDKPELIIIILFSVQLRTDF
jgi:hypothetical protein